MPKKLALGFAVDALIQPEINLLNTILKTSSVLDGRWELVEQGLCDAVLVGSIPSALDRYSLDAHTKKITIKRRGEEAEGYVFFKPIRAEELVKILLQIQSGATDSEAQRKNWADIVPDVSYKLRKWPTSDIMSRDKRFTRLATYLTRGYKSVSELTEISGCPEMICNQFIAQLEAAKLLLVKSGAPHQEKTPRPEVKMNRSVIFLLRQKLGLNSRS